MIEQSNEFYPSDWDSSDVAHIVHVASRFFQLITYPRMKSRYAILPFTFYNQNKTHLNHFEMKFDEIIIPRKICSNPEEPFFPGERWYKPNQMVRK